MVVAAVLGLFVHAVESNRYENFANAERRQAEHFVEELSEAIELALLDLELRARGLTTAIELNDDIGQDRFTELAERFMKMDASILNLAVVERGIIALVHPYSENRQLIGHDLRQNQDQWAVLDRVYRTGTVAIQGPIKVLQGKRGLLIRMPITTFGAGGDRTPTAKVVSVVIDADAVFQDALRQTRASEAQGPSYQAALTTGRPDAEIIGDARIFARDPAAMSFSVAGASLTLGVVPRAGWGAGYAINWLPDLAIVFIVALAFYVMHLVARHRGERDRAQARLNTAIETLPDGFVIFDAEDRLVACNEKYKEFYNESRDILVPGARFEDILRYGLQCGQYAEAIGREEEWLAKRMAAHGTADSMLEQKLKDGRWLQIYERQLPDGGRVGVRVDITQLKQHQAELEETNASLREALAQRDLAEQRFSDVAELSKDWVWEMDKNFRFTFLSGNVVRSGVTSLIGKTRQEAFAGFPKIFESADWAWLENKERAHEPFRDFIYQAHQFTDDNKWVRISGVPIFDENGEFAGYRGVGADITDVYNAMREAEAASAAKTEFLSVMSHELRTPLTVVLGYNAFLAKPGFLSSIKALESHIEKAGPEAKAAGRHVDAIKAEIAKYAGKIELSGKHLLALINDILDLSKIEAGKLHVEPVDVPLDPLIASVADQLSDRAQQKSLELRVETHGEIVVADEMRLRQILINLAGNALKFTEHGHVTIRTEPRGDAVAIHVEDSGSGIPKDKLELIFGRFDQIDPSSTRAKGGTGLGLAISRQLVELQGGHLTVTSQVDVGSVFTFTLPAATAEVAKGAGALANGIAPHAGQGAG